MIGVRDNIYRGPISISLHNGRDGNICSRHWANFYVKSLGKFLMGEGKDARLQIDEDLL